MQDDDLIGLLLGCGCKRQCCCGDKEGADVAPSNLFQAAGRTRPQVPHDDDSPFVPPPPELDGWTRPVVIGLTALTVPSADGPLLVGNLPTSPAQVGPSTELLSHVQEARLFRTPTFFPDLAYPMTQTEVAVFPFSALQRRLEATFPTQLTVSDLEGNVYTAGPLPARPPARHSVLWRIRDEYGAASGVYYGEETAYFFAGGQEDRPLTVPGTGAALELATRIYVRHWTVSDYGPSAGDDDPGYWVVDPPCELVWLQVKIFQDGKERLGPAPFLHWFLPANSEGVVYGHYLPYSPGNDQSGQGFETLWKGERAGGVRAGVRLTRAANAPDPAAVPEAGGQTRWPVQRLLWSGWGWPSRPDPAPYDHSYEADVPAGRVVQRAPEGTLSTGSHRDHLRDGASLSLGGTALPATSWAVLARRTGDGPDEGSTPGLLTCDGRVISAYWTPEQRATSVDVTLLLDLRDERGDPLPAGSITDALLESELEVLHHPDHVRLLYTLRGQRQAAILAPWNAWRDLDKTGWAKAKKSRPRSLKQWAALPRSRWPTPPPHGLAYQGPITPPVLDEAGLPRYGRSPAYLSGPDPFNARWPWAFRAALDQPDERPPLKPTTLKKPLATGWSGGGATVVTGRAKGEKALKAVGGHWAFTTARGRAGLRPFVLPLSAPPPTLDAPGLRLEHLAALRVADAGGDT